MKSTAGFEPAPVPFPFPAPAPTPAPFQAFQGKNLSIPIESWKFETWVLKFQNVVLDFKKQKHVIVMKKVIDIMINNKKEPTVKFYLFIS